MAGVAAKFIPRELLVHTPDGAIRPLLLERDRYTLGRSSANELCYPEDAGLSRQHLVLERDRDAWTVRDLGSKNGTFVNGVRITSPYPLGKNDRVTAGNMPLAELFKLIMNLSVEAVGATRGVLMTLEGSEGSELVVRQALGEGFR